MGDLPDWTQATSNAGTVLENGFVAAGATFDLDVSNNNSLVIEASCVTPNTKIVLALQWFTDSTQAVSVTNGSVTAIAQVGEQGQVEFETPVYAGYLEIINETPQQIALTIIGASRTVPAPRILNSAGPGRSFSVTTVFVAGTGYPMTANDIGPSTFNSNGATTVTCQSNTAATLFVTYVDWGGIVSQYPILSIAAGSFATTTVGLPQSAIGFILVPSAPNAAGNAVVNANPAQL